MPVVLETNDSLLGDINGFHVNPEHVADALSNAVGGAVIEGAVGGGSSMICHELKGGIGIGEASEQRSGRLDRLSHRPHTASVTNCASTTTRPDVTWYRLTHRSSSLRCRILAWARSRCMRSQ